MDGNLESYTLPNGDTTTFTYNQDFQIVGKVMPGGGEKQVFYAISRCCAARTRGARARSTTPTQDLVEDKKEVGSWGDIADFQGIDEYTKEGNSDGRVTGMQVNGKDLYQADYDGEGYPTYINAAGASVVCSYNGQYHKLRHIEDNQGNDTHYDYYVNGNLTCVTDALGNQTLYEYCQGSAKGLVSKITDAEGHTNQFIYDNYGNVVETIYAENNHTYYSRSIRGNVLEVTDALGGHTNFTYDILDRVTQISRGDTEILYAFQPNNSDFGWFGHVSTITDPLGREIHIQYDMDKLGREIKRLHLVCEQLRAEIKTLPKRVPVRQKMDGHLLRHRLRNRHS